MLQRFEGRREEFRELAIMQKRFPQELWDGFADIGLLGCLRRRSTAAAHTCWR
jgi:hypothetical protein